ncbi:MAG: hypothetical protein MJ229_01675 [bacterium]|nr:hypothetical protein [bacterium]
MKISNNYTNQNFGMKITAPKSFWKSIEKLEGKDLKKCSKALKKIEKNTKIKDSYVIEPIKDKVVFVPKDFQLGRIDTHGFKLTNSKGEEALSLTKKSAFYVDETFFDYKVEDNVSPAKFIEYISKKLKKIEKFEQFKNATNNLKSQVASTIKNIKS